MSHTFVLSDLVLHGQVVQAGRSDPFLKLTEGAVEIGRTVPQRAAEGETLRVPKFTAYGALASGLVLELWERDLTNPDVLIGALQLGPIISGGDVGRVEEAPLLAADGTDAGAASFEYELLQVDASSAEAIEPALLNAIVDTFEPEGETPTGEANAAYDGNGTLNFLSGNRYAGELKGSMMAGRGEYAWKAEQVQYAGDFTRNTLEGQGAYEWKDGSKYEGEIKAGLRHGSGVFRSPDGTLVYDGQWQEGKRHGVGKLTYDSEGKECYEGEWQLDLKVGKGTMRYASGNVYEGSWHADVKSGQGTMMWSDLRERYEGEWSEGRQHGWGEHTWLRPQLQSSPYQMREPLA